MASNLEITDEASEENVYDKSLNIWIGANTNQNKIDNDFHLDSLDLHTECSIGHYECVKRIIERQDVFLDVKNKGGWTPLMYACYTGHENIVNLLLEAGVSVNSVNDKMVTPLMLAASCGNDGIARCLLEQHASIDSVDNKGWTALYHATFSGHQNVIKLLLEMGANANICEPLNEMTPLMEATSAGHEVIVQYFLQEGINFKAMNKHGHSALTLAMLKGHSKIVSLLKDHARRLENATFERDKDQGINQKKNKQPSVIREGPEVIQELMKKKLAIVTGHGAQHFQSPFCPWPETPQTTSAHSGNRVSSHTIQLSSYNQQIISSQSNLLSPGTYPPMNLHQLLVELGLSKYSPIFEEQDVDLAVFLTLTDNDLKEIGVNLLGPRKKMMMAINRWHGNSSSISGYQPARSLLSPEADFQEVILGLHQKNQHLQQQLQREEQLRATLESCLMRDRVELHEFVDRLFQHFNRFSTRKDVLIANLGECIREFENVISKQYAEVNIGQGKSQLENVSLQNVTKLKRCCTDIEALLNAICNDTHLLIVSVQNRN